MDAEQADHILGTSSRREALTLTVFRHRISMAAHENFGVDDVGEVVASQHQRLGRHDVCPRSRSVYRVQCRAGPTPRGLRYNETLGIGGTPPFRRMTPRPGAVRDPCIPSDVGRHRPGGYVVQLPTAGMVPLIAVDRS